MTYYMGYRQSGGYGYPPSTTILSITWCQWGERFSTRYPPSSISPTTTLIGRVVCIPWSAMVWVQRRKVSSGSTGRTSSWWLEWGDITSSHWKADALPPPRIFSTWCWTPWPDTGPRLYLGRRPGRRATVPNHDDLPKTFLFPGKHSNAATTPLPSVNG